MCRMEGFVLKANESETPLHRIQVVCEDFSLAAGAAVNISARGHRWFWQGRPVRTPLRWNANVRTWLLDPAQNLEGWTFEGYLHDPQVTLGAQPRFQSYAARYFSQSSDRADTLPEQWSGSADVLNCYDAAFYGGRIHALPEQIPAVEPFLSLDDVYTFLATGYCVNLAGNPFLRERVLKWHVFWCDQTDESAGRPLARSCHLCGDATRHFRTIRDAVGVGSFDTGFPVDFGWLRRELGPEVMISGGPHVGLLRHGTPEACYREAERILASGVREGGKFILQEGNNLPPLCPMENLQAVYLACLEHGSFF